MKLFHESLSLILSLCLFSWKLGCGFENPTDCKKEHDVLSTKWQRQCLWLWFRFGHLCPQVVETYGNNCNFSKKFLMPLLQVHSCCDVNANSSPIFEPAHHPSHSFSLTKLFSECKGCSFFLSWVDHPHFKTSDWSPNMWYSCWSKCTFLINPTFCQNLMQYFGFRKINHILTETRMLKLVLRLRCVMIEL